MKKGIIAVAALALLFFSGFAGAGGSKRATDDHARTLSTVVVRLPGPAMWQFTRGVKTVWVLGTHQPLPEDVQFSADEIEARVAQSQAVVGPYGLEVGENIGIFRGLSLWPSIRRTRFNENGQSLRDVLPSATYARWLQAKAKYLNDDADVERLRPMYAAFELFEAAMKQAGLDTVSRVSPLVARTAKRNDILVIDAKLRLPIHAPKNAVKEFGISHADDVRCLEQTLVLVDAVIQAARELGEAWAAGDVGRFAAAAKEGNAMNACWARLTNEAIGRQQGIANLYQQVDARWLAALQRALREHDMVFTTLPLRDLLESRNLVAALQREGFRPVPAHQTAEVASNAAP